MIQGGASADRQERVRFRAEAEAAARLQHPHIVQIYEVGEHEGRPFCVLEYVSGGSLAQRLARAPLTPLRAAELAVTLARAMHDAHEAGIVHRDLKPANVLLAEDDVPKITDFGLAKRLDIQTDFTVSGAILGTPGYRAPEQARGRPGGITAATDTYALGAILYECLTGTASAASRRDCRSAPCPGSWGYSIRSARPGT